jgi:hypothetical protein
MNSILFVSSYGDFTIAMFVFKRAILSSPTKSSFRLVASVHLQPLYEDMLKTDPDLQRLSIEFEDFKISHKILGVLTNRHFFKRHSFTEIVGLKRYLNQPHLEHNKWMVEQDRRSVLLSFLLGKKMEPVHKHGNVYDSYASLTHIDRKLLLSDKKSTSRLSNILILPDSRMRSKSLNQDLINAIASCCIKGGRKVTTAFFKRIPFKTEGEQAVHVQFIDLIRLLQLADLVITADSLPAHLAQYYAKPHIVVYRDRPNGEWLTPFTRENHSFCTFGEIHVSLGLLIDKLST